MATNSFRARALALRDGASRLLGVRAKLLRGPRPVRNARIGNVVRVEPGIADPALLVIVCHALVRERDHAVVLTGRAGVEQRLDADVLVIARIVDLVELVAPAELGTDGVPQELHDL